MTLDLRQFSYGTTSAVVTGMALVAGLDAAGGRRASIVAGLLIFALADNLTDSLSIHLYQEAERLEQRAAFRATLVNFVTRLALTLSFVLMVLLVPPAAAVPASVAWGVGLLVTLTILLARDRGAPVLPEIGRHLVLALAVIVASKLIGAWVMQVAG
jgi:VIT1/CCC1 family predicted Fe2+/Mn2+ transporter